MRRKFIKTSGIFFLFGLFIFDQTVVAQSSAFSYQGKLVDANVAVSGQYDFTFRLFDASSGGTQVGSDIARNDVQITVGIFTVMLDFGAAAFMNAGDRYLEIAVRPGASTGSYVTLLPRQKIESAPYAVKSLSSSLADDSGKLGGVNASEYVLTTDPRMTDPRAPTPGSANYIQNSTGLQSPANFYISGNAGIGGMFSANIVTSETQFNIGNSRAFISGPGDNTFAGLSAGANTTGTGNSFFGIASGLVNTTGISNSFFGYESGTASNGSFNSFFGERAGRMNTSGNSNSFFGKGSGEKSTTGSDNSFFGSASGGSNTLGNLNAFFGSFTGFSNTTGAKNTFLGRGSGITNTTGSNNTVIGADAAVGANNLTFATAIGSEATVNASNTLVLGRSVDTVQIPGNLGIAGAFASSSFIGNGAGLTNLDAGNITTGLVDSARLPVVPTNKGGTGMSVSGAAGNFLRSDGTNWTSSPLQPADIPPGSMNYVQNTTASQTSANFNISGNGTAGGTLSGNIINAATQFDLGGNRILSAAGTENVFAGVGAGAANTTGSANAVFGSGAGQSNTTGSSEAFFGAGAGFQNTTGNFNAFFGNVAGFSNSSGSDNAFFGRSAGRANTTGGSNAFFGRSAGDVNSTGGDNAFFGGSAGSSNTTGSGNTVLGFSANTGAGNLTNAAAIGYRAQVDQSNSIVLGSINGFNGAVADTFVGIGTTTPADKLHVVGNSRFTGNLTVNGALNATLPGGSGSYIQNSSTQQSSANFNISGTGSANILNTATQFSLGGSRILSAAGNDNLFAGLEAGAANVTGSNNTFVGASAGSSNMVSGGNSFFGSFAGSQNTMGNNSFFGASAGFSNTTGFNNSFFGSATGFSNVTGSNNAFFGGSAGVANNTGIGNSFFGSEAGYVNTSGAYNAFAGSFAGKNNTTGSFNSFVGTSAGFYNTTGSYNGFFGIQAGLNNIAGTANTMVGYSANVGADNLTNATAVGNCAMVSQSNSLVLGSTIGFNCATANTNVGIGTTAPKTALHVQSGSIYVSGPSQGVIMTSPNGTCWQIRVTDAGALYADFLPCP